MGNFGVDINEEYWANVKDPSWGDDGWLLWIELKRRGTNEYVAGGSVLSQEATDQGMREITHAFAAGYLAAPAVRDSFGDETQ